ncbi:MAG: GNAT family N-acetyltransferase [Scytonema sp. RU_4_4]|nr:GNAT family N-acetyltransferase [Scytonema sp. RU_4_4]
MLCSLYLGRSLKLVTKKNYDSTSWLKLVSTLSPNDGGFFSFINFPCQCQSNAYIVDVWTFTPYRRQGIASTMMQMLLDELPGQHVCLFTDEALNFYKELGFTKGEICMEKVIGKWLVNTSFT